MGVGTPQATCYSEAIPAWSSWAGLLMGQHASPFGRRPHRRANLHERVDSVDILPDAEVTMIPIARRPDSLDCSSSCVEGKKRVRW